MCPAPVWTAAPWAPWRSTRTSMADNSAVPYLDDTQAQANDNRIINVALRLQAEPQRVLSAW